MTVMYLINNITTYLTMLICVDYFGISGRERSRKRLILSSCVFYCSNVGRRLHVFRGRI